MTLPHSALAPQPADLICLSIYSNPLFNIFLCKTVTVWWFVCSPGRWQNCLQIQLGRGWFHAAEKSSNCWQDSRARPCSSPGRGTWMEAPSKEVLELVNELRVCLCWLVWMASLASWHFQPKACLLGELCTQAAQHRAKTTTKH